MSTKLSDRGARVQRIPWVELSCLLFQPGLTKAGGGNKDYIKKFPSDLNELSRFDVVFLGDVLRKRPARWLPPRYASFDLLLAAAADQSVARMRKVWGPREDDWRWGRVNSLELQHPLALRGPLRWLLNVGPVSHDGSSYTVNATRGGFGPAMRFVADLGNFDNSLMEVTPGESGQYGSPFYRDEFARWVSGHGIPAPFSPAAEAKARKHELILESLSQP